MKTWPLTALVQVLIEYASPRATAGKLEKVPKISESEHVSSVGVLSNVRINHLCLI